MFWGLVLEPGKRYSTTVEKSFHVSKAALDCSSVRTDNEILSVILETEGSESILCNLCKQKGILQENLDLNFMTGDRLTFECRGHGRIHLSGYLLPDEDDDMSGMLGDEEESEEEEETEWSAARPDKPKKEKRKQDAPPDVPSKKKKTEAKEEDEEGESDSEQDDEVSDLSDGGLEDEDLEDEDEEEEEGSEKDEDDESEEEDEGSLNLSAKERKKLQQKQDKSKTPNKQNANTPKKTPVTNGLESPKKTPGGGPNSTPKQKQLLAQGVVVKEIRVGNGAPAKSGKTVAVHYIGKLKDSNKVFDKQMKGEGFKFKLGKGEVIKGWDIGLQGMKIGGKRVIHCPPEVAYGVKGIPPKIPPNSTLIFDVELKNVF